MSMGGIANMVASAGPLAAKGSTFGPWGAAAGAGLGLLSGITGGKDAQKPQVTTTTQQLTPFGGDMGNNILMNILNLAQQRYIDNPPRVGPSKRMNRIFDNIYRQGMAPPTRTYWRGGGGN